MSCTHLSLAQTEMIDPEQSFTVVPLGWVNQVVFFVTQIKLGENRVLMLKQLTFIVNNALVL